jgi:hypothetical protein
MHPLLEIVHPAANGAALLIAGTATQGSLKPHDGTGHETRQPSCTLYRWIAIANRTGFMPAPGLAASWRGCCRTSYSAHWPGSQPRRVPRSASTTWNWSAGNCCASLQHITRTNELRGPFNERRAIPDQDRCPIAASRSAFGNPGTSEMHFRRLTRRGTGDALRAVPVRRRRHRGCRRLRAHGRQTSRRVAAPRAGPCQRAREPAQRAPRLDANREHRGRPRHVSPAVRRAAHVRHRRFRTTSVVVDLRVKVRTQRCG